LASELSVNISYNGTLVSIKWSIRSEVKGEQFDKPVSQY